MSYNKMTVLHESNPTKSVVSSLVMILNLNLRDENGPNGLSLWKTLLYV